MDYYYNKNIYCDDLQTRTLRGFIIFFRTTDVVISNHDLNVKEMYAKEKEKIQLRKPNEWLS